MVRVSEPVAIIILSLNKREQTLRCLARVVQLDYPAYDVVVVDNGSTDGSADAVAQAHPAVHLIRCERNHGVAGGRNLGIAYAQQHLPHGYCFFVDNDALVERGTLRELVSAAEAGVGIVTPKIYSIRHPQVIQCAGGHELNFFTGRIRGIGSGQLDHGQCDVARDVASAPGVKLVRRELWDAIGVYDERFNPYGWEDVDLSVRARRAGFRIRYAPKAVVRHQGGRLTRGRERMAYDRSKLKNFFLLMRKHASPLQWLCVVLLLPWRAVEWMIRVRTLRRRISTWQPPNDTDPAVQRAAGPPVVSVVIPCRGHAKELEHALQGLQRQTIQVPYEVIVVNSEAAAAVGEMVARFPNIRLVTSRDGLTPGEARNAGVAQARGTYVACLDADCVPAPEWLAEAMQILMAGAVVVGGSVGDAHPLNPIAATDNLLQFLEFSSHRPDGEIQRIPSCNFAMRRSSYEALGGFRVRYPTGADGLFSRDAAARWPGGIRFARAMRVYHAGRTDLHSFWRHQSLLGLYRGRLGVGLPKAWYQRLGRHTIFTLPVVGKRLSFLVGRTIRWNPAGLVRVMILLPILLVGLTAWAKAFRDGCRLGTEEAV